MAGVKSEKCWQTQENFHFKRMTALLKDENEKSCDIAEKKWNIWSKNRKKRAIKELLTSSNTQLVSK